MAPSNLPVLPGERESPGRNRIPAARVSRMLKRCIVTEISTGCRHLLGNRFRHAAAVHRWRPDKVPSGCGYDQLEVTAPYELQKVFDAGRDQLGT